MVQFHPFWLKLHFPLFLRMLMYDNKFKTKENNISTKNKIELQHILKNYIYTCSHRFNINFTAMVLLQVLIKSKNVLIQNLRSWETNNK